MTAPRSTGWKRWLSLAIGTAFTVLLLSWALKGVSLVAVGDALQHANWGWLATGWLAHLSVYWVRAWRWGTLLSASVDPGRFNSRLAATFLGFGAACVLPAYAGEVVRAAMLYRLDRVPVAVAIGSVLVERLLDVAAVMLLLVVPIAWGGVPSGLEKLAITPILLALLLSYGIGWTAARFPAAIARCIGQISHWIGLRRFQTAIESRTQKFLDGLKVLQDPRLGSWAVVQTLLGWALNAVTYWAGFMAFDIRHPGIPGAFFTQSTAALAIALPSTPGYVGPFEAGIRFALEQYGIPTTLILAYAIALRLLMYVTIPLIAAGIALRMGLSLTALSSSQRQ